VLIGHTTDFRRPKSLVLNENGQSTLDNGSKMNVDETIRNYVALRDCWNLNIQVVTEIIRKQEKRNQC
jgi:ABC-type iron transport system FetAB ATPase subunit